MFGLNNNTIEGLWTGWVCDQDSMKTISKQRDPVGYLEQYPRGKASNLNTLFQGFVIFHHGEWFTLDKRGSEMVKQLIRKSKSSSGFLFTVLGSRKGNKISVREVIDRSGQNIPPIEITKESRNRQIRGEFSKMGI